MFIVTVFAKYHFVYWYSGALRLFFIVCVAAGITIGARDDQGLLWVEGYRVVGGLAGPAKLIFYGIKRRYRWIYIVCL